MRPKYIFSSRKTRRARESPKMRRQREKYPSLAEKIIKDSDIILEVLDARFISETQNSELRERLKKSNKKLILVVNKSDLADKKCPAPGSCIFVSCKKRKGIKRLRELIKKESSKIKNKEKITIGIIGYPNVGKSSLINILIRKSSAPVGSEAGFTKGIQKLKLTKNIVLLDTPGVIPKAKYSNTEKGKMADHAIVGARSWTQIKEPELVVSKILKNFPRALENHYRTNSKADAEEIINELGARWNCFKKGGNVNEDKTARRILKEWQEGIIKI